MGDFSMSKPNLGRTKTVKDRVIYVYLSSIEMAKEWKDRAEKPECRSPNGWSRGLKTQ
jgi:hypothetical protein